MPRPTARLSVFVALVAAIAGAADASASAAEPTRWLCRPGLQGNPCAPSLSTTAISPTGEVLGRSRVKRIARPRVDCFYVYPTTSDQPAPQANLRVDPELRSIAEYQAARYSEICRVFAPVYRQITLAGLLTPEKVTRSMLERAYTDVRDAWRSYLRRDNKDRGVILVGHSQGTYILRRLIAKEIDPKAEARRRLVGAYLLGGDVLVKRGSDRGGDFENVRACQGRNQLGCVVAFSTFDETPPASPRFGVPSRAPGIGPERLEGLEVLCTNPAALGGGSAPLDTVLPTTPCAPGSTIGALVAASGFPRPATSSAWFRVRGAYRGRCSRAGGANVLRITGVPGAPDLKPSPDATWGLHLIDANLALGDLVALARRQAAVYGQSR